jgi:phasin family protein
MSDKRTLPGTDFMTKAMEAFRANAEEFARLFGDLRLPGLPDRDAILEAHKRNVEALANANRVAIEGVQAVARRNMDMLQEAMTEVSQTMRSLTSSGAPTDRAAHQAELLKRAYDRAVEHARELSELIQKTNSEAATVLNRRFVEAMDEVKGLIAQAKASGEK